VKQRIAVTMVLSGGTANSQGISNLITLSILAYGLEVYKQNRVFQGEIIFNFIHIHSESI